MKTFCGLVLLAAFFSAAAMPEPALYDGFENRTAGKSSNVGFSAGKKGRGAYFSIRKHSFVKYDGKFIDPDAGTVSVWVKPDLPLVRDSQRTILNIGGPAKELQGVNIAFDGRSLIFPYMRISAPAWKSDRWNHIAYTWKLVRNSKKSFPFQYEITAYINGRGAAKRMVNVRPVPASVITLGAYPVPEYGRPQLFELDGALDEFRLYRQCLTPAEIAFLAGEKTAYPAPVEKVSVPVRKTGGVKPFVLSGTQGSVTLDKKTYIEIIIAQKPEKNEVTAAYDLRTHLLKITGGRISVRKTQTPGRAFRIFIGKAAGLKEKFAHDEIFISITSDRCILAGDAENGALNAVYSLLEHAGFRWFDAGKDGGFVPAGKSVELPVGKWRYVPFFAMRRIQLSAPYDYLKGLRSRDLDEWGRRNKLDLGNYAKFHKMVAPHLDRIIPESMFASHPEYFGMDDRGIRDVPSRNKLNPCTGNPDVVRLFQQKAIELLRKDRRAQYFSIEPIDGGGWCLCEKCRKLDAAPENYTDRVITLANQITEALEKAFPGEGKAARFFAYQGYVNLPVRTRARGNLQVEVTRGAPELVAGWAKYVSNLQRWDYNGWFTFKWGPMPLSLMPEKIRLARENHYRGGYFDEGVASVLSLGQPFYYIESKLMWDPDYDLELLLDDFFEKYYGKAGIPMRKCFDLIERETLRRKSSEELFTEYGRIIFQPYIYDHEMWDECISLCREALKLAGNDPVIRRRVELTMMTYLFAGVAGDALIAGQYAADKDHAFHKYIDSRKKENSAKLLEAVKLAKKLGVEKVRGNCEPGNLEAVIASWAYPLKIDIAPFYEIFYPSAAKKKAVTEKKGEWKMVFSDDFSRKDLGNDWKIIHGNWKIANGVLSGRGDAVYINKKFPGDQRLCFDAWVEKGNAACDLDGILCDNSMARYGNSGYLFAFGTYGNNFSRINREKVQVLRIARPVIEPGRRHHIVCERSGNVLSWHIDGRLVAQYRETFRVLEGEYIGLYTDAGAFFDNVKVYTR